MGLSAAVDTIGVSGQRVTHVPSHSTHAQARGGCRRRKEPRVDCLLLSGFLPGVDHGTAHLMVGSLAGVEIVAAKVHWKNFLAAGRCSNSSRRF